MEKSLRSEKFIFNGIEFIRVDGVWFEYIDETYIPLRDSTILEQLYQEKHL